MLKGKKLLLATLAWRYREDIKKYARIGWAKASPHIKQFQNKHAGSQQTNLARATTKPPVVAHPSAAPTGSKSTTTP